ncbi:MAG: PH domain-containing protein [Bacteroidota bacterium]
MKKFKCSLDKTSKIIGGIVFVPILFLGCLSFANRENDTSYITLFSSIPPIVILVVTFLYRPMNYTVTSSLIIINRPVSLFKINRIEIAKCSIVSKKEMSGTIRTFGNGGLFGYTGYYRNAKFGTMRWFATQRKNYVLIEKINGKKIIITPDEPENFIAALG